MTKVKTPGEIQQEFEQLYQKAIAKMPEYEAKLFDLYKQEVKNDTNTARTAGSRG